jgi:hypothetical protein
MRTDSGDTTARAIQSSEMSNPFCNRHRPDSRSSRQALDFNYL